MHFSQMILQERFQAFDWGEQENLLKYNNRRPPQVDLGRATPAQAIYVAPVQVLMYILIFKFSSQGNDYLVQPEDYNRLVSELPNVVRLHIVNYANWNHQDFLTAIDAPRYLSPHWNLNNSINFFRLLYPHIIEEMNKYR